MRTCKECGKEISRQGKTGYCADHYRIGEEQERIRLWLETGTLPIAANTRPRGYVRNHIEKEQSHKCAICELEDNWNGKSLVFVLDHIDGNASNNERENLRLVCPNCDSQLDTFKSKNKNSARTYDKDYRKNNSKNK